TGRENIFLNGAILGMSRVEIGRKFQDIVAFAEVEKFLDTPVKRYSSGMYLRLAFAVAAHLEPEILVVDEVLAVGDAEFQEKCLGKMQDVATGGRTVLFVSHSMGAIQALCDRAVVLASGRVVFDGNTQDAIRHYLSARVPTSSVDAFEGCVRLGTGEARILCIRFEDDQANLQTHFRMGEPINVIVRANFPTEVVNPTFGVNFMTDSGIMVADCRSAHYDFKIGAVKGVVEYRMRIDAIPLYPRNYVAEPWVADARCLSDFDWIRNAATFVVTSGPKFMGGANVTSDHGISHLKTAWNARVISSEEHLLSSAGAALLVD
ncbi:Wzt carbohydrate-binding domain-containing protein, partial [Dolichospermum sp. ST_sed3]|nr:Wzt carbohydrate-binding domain-containing protein [Dolichospermum sp. ST_sed3]